MANLEIITGRTGEQHVLAIDDAEIYRTLLGNGDFILPTGQKFAAQMNGANKVDIYNGTAIMQGRQVKIRSGYQELETAAGVSGMKRQDAIIIEYEKDGDYDTVALKVVKGANNASSYVPPVLPHVNGNIDLGEKHQMLLWYVRYDGINFSELIDMRTVLDTTPIQAAIDSATSAKAQIEADMTSYKAQIRQELEAIKNVVDIAPLTTVVGHGLVVEREDGTKTDYFAILPTEQVSEKTFVLSENPVANSTIECALTLNQVPVHGFSFVVGATGETTYGNYKIVYDGEKTLVFIRRDGEVISVPVKLTVEYDYSIDDNHLMLSYTGYTYSSNDIFTVYLNGLKVPVDAYTVSDKNGALQVYMTGFITGRVYDDVEIEVWRPEEV